MDVEPLKDDVREGPIAVERLAELLVTMQRQLQAAEQHLEQTRQETRPDEAGARPGEAAD